MTIYEQILDLLKGKEGCIITATSIKDDLKLKHGTNRDSTIPSDYCYNLINDGIPFDKHVFEYIKWNTYKFHGENFPYTGKVMHQKKGIVGEWINGKKYLFDDRN